MSCSPESMPKSARGLFAVCLLIGLCLGCGQAGQQAADSSNDVPGGEGSGEAIARASTPTTSESTGDRQHSMEETHDHAHDHGHPHEEAAAPAGTTAVTGHTALDANTLSATGTPEQQIVDTDLWISDFELAKVRAKKENKDILMDFTGSDWCGWCIRLHNEVFQYKEFADYADENFVLLELDYPRDKSILTLEVQAQNAELQNRFAIQGFPTIILTDAAGKPYGQTGYQEGGATNYVSHLTDLKEQRVARDEAFAAAKAAEGIGKAKKLHAALRLLPPDLVLPAYEAEIAEIVKLDENNEAGLRDQYASRLTAARFRSATKRIEQQVQSAGDVDAALAELAKIESEFADYADGRLPMMLIRMQLLQLGERSEEAIDVIDAIVKEIPDNQRALVQLFVTKADFLVKLDRRDEAKAALQQARDVADPQIHAQIDSIEEQMFAQSSNAEDAGDAETQN